MSSLIFSRVSIVSCFPSGEAIVCPNRFRQASFIPQSPMVERILAFWAKLALLCGLTPLFWPWSRHRNGGILIVVALAAALPMMAVTSPHSHYFPPLIYLAAVAGIAAVSRMGSGSLVAGAAALVAVGTWLSFHVDDVTLKILGG